MPEMERAPSTVIADEFTLMHNSVASDIRLRLPIYALPKPPPRSQGRRHSCRLQLHSGMGKVRTRCTSSQFAKAPLRSTRNESSFIPV